MKRMKPKIAWLLAMVLTLQGIAPVLPALAEPLPGTQRTSRQMVATSDGTDEEEWEDGDLENDLTTPSDAEEETEGDMELATPGNAIENIFADMPEIGTEEFTAWFFGHTDKQELWDWFLSQLELAADESFMEWYAKNEASILAAYQEFSGIALMANSTGDLWDEWNGNMDFPGDGTESAPYQISSLSYLMGLSEAVASGTTFEGEYFELTEDIDLGGINVNLGNWNPIGWYQNKSDLTGDVTHPFKGHFDGCGNTISGLKIINGSLNLKNIGLFGVIDGGSVRNLTVDADDIYGDENTAVLAGAIKGDAVIYNVTVSGYVRSSEDAGGIAAEVTGSTKYATIENCTADSIVLNSLGTTGYVGGIAGNVQKTNLIDNVVITQNGDANRIQGNGYVGGIAGRMNLTNIYNSYVDGTIGGNGSKAAGGIVGKYESGNLVLARMAGDIGPTNQGSAKREGTFVGTRESRHHFTYGTEKSTNLSFLFTNSANKAKKVFGSNIDGDNTFTKAAHIGYWTDNEKKYVTVAGQTEESSGGQYFYEELEDAVRYIVTLKLGKEFTAEGYAKDLAFRLDHFAPGYMGEPVKGWLVSIPRIDTKNANGTYDTDVATLTAIPSTNSSYYRMIDKDNAAAIAPGATVTVATAPKNSGTNRYQMVVDQNEAGGVKAPTYIDEMGDQVAMNYVNGGSYTFTMPECDTELNVEYIKVTTKLAVDPTETTISVTHTRSGDRKNPDVTTEVRNAEGILIARYINGSIDTAVDVQPVTIHAEHNGAGETADRTVKWSVDDTDLINNQSDTGYTVKDAVIMPNLSSAFITGIINREVQAQADNQYREKINNTIYPKNAVVTAATNPDTSVNGQSVYGNCRVTVTFQIVDNTTVRVEGMNLNKSSISYTVTRKLTGDRTNPTETITCTEPAVLTATLNPEQPFLKNVSWSDLEGGKIIALQPSGANTQDCRITAQYDPAGKENPAWIQNVINEDNNRRAADPYHKLSGSAIYTEIVTATSEDQTHGHVTASCDVIINFVTVDETVIHPESVQMSKDTIQFDLTATKAGDAQSKTVSVSGFDPVDLDCTVIPDTPDSEGYKPYDRSVVWSVSDQDVLSVNADGLITPNQNAQWITDALVKPPYKATKKVTVYATTNDGQKIGKTEVTLNYQTRCLEMKEEAVTYDITLKKAGRRSSPTLSWEGGDAKDISAVTYQDARPVKYTSSNPEILTVADDGSITPVLDASLEWMQPAMARPYTATAAVTIAAEDGTGKDVCVVTMNITVVDTTTSGSGGSGSGGGGGGGGGGSSKGVTAGGAVAATAKIPDYVVTGTWFQNAAGKWMFTDGSRTYANEWAAIHNPYANTAIGQSAFDWFRFDAEGFLVTGWYTDVDGSMYYLSPVSDGTLGHMVTGWQWVDDNCYYFNKVSNGKLGALLRNTTTPDGNQVNENGIWTVNGVAQVRGD